MNLKLRQALNKALEVADDDLLADVIRAKRVYLDTPGQVDPEMMLHTVLLILKIDQVDKESPEESHKKLKEEEPFDIEAIFKAMREFQEDSPQLGDAPSKKEATAPCSASRGTAARRIFKKSRGL